jgi:hypothetical protein
MLQLQNLTINGALSKFSKFYLTIVCMYFNSICYVQVFAHFRNANKRIEGIFHKRESWGLKMLTLPYSRILGPILRLIYLWKKMVCNLFCFVVMRSIELGCLKSCSWCLWKALSKGGVHGLGSFTFETCSAKVLEYWTIFSLKIKLNWSCKFQRNWNVPSVLLERSWWAGFNGIYLIRFRFRLWEILIFKANMPFHYILEQDSTNPTALLYALLYWWSILRWLF